MLELIQTKRTDKRLLERMTIHYSQPKGFVGRNICYACLYNGEYYGHIIAGSATRFLPNRNEYFCINIKQLNNIINNIFFNVSPISDKYPIRNFTVAIIKCFVKQAAIDWMIKYGDECVGFETLIEKPRTGELYIRAGWEKVGETKGFTCKRVSGRGTDSWSGRRVWNTNPNELRPKIVLCYKI
jgi:hypothetical protein